jgi:hypothetical protein
VLIAAPHTAVGEHPTVDRTPLAKLIEYPADLAHVAGLLADTVGVNPAGKDAFGWTVSGQFLLLRLRVLGMKSIIIYIYPVLLRLANTN